MKKNSVLLRVGVAAMVLTLATTSLMSGTLAKYTSEGFGVGKAVVAKWNPQLSIASANATGTTQETAITFNLKDTANTNVAENKIAPGTKGSIPIVVDLGGSEVNCKYEIFISSKGGEGAVANLTSAPLKFELVDGSKRDLLTFSETNAAKSGELKMVADGTTTFSKKNYTLEWEWPYTSTDSDIADNAAGAAAAATATEAAASIEYTVRVVLTQLERPASAG